MSIVNKYGIGIGRSEEILTSLDYNGFDLKDIITQSENGTYVQPVAGMESPRFHTNAALPVGAGQEIDKIILRAVTASPRFFRDLVDAGCTYNIPWGTFLSRYAIQNLSDAPVIANDFTDQGGAYSNAYQSQADYSEAIVPVPLMFHRFKLSKRQIAAAGNSSNLFGGMNLEQQEIYVKSVSMASSIDALLWNGTTALNVNVGNTTIPVYGVLNHPVVVENATPLTLDVTEPQAFIDGLRESIQVLLNQNYEGPFVMYYSRNIQFAMQADYINQFPLRTIEDRIRQFGDISDVRSTQFLNPPADPTSTTAGTIIIMKMDPQVIDVVKEAEIRVAQYANDPELVKYIMYCALAPRIKEDYYGRVGIQLVNVTVTGG